MNKLIIISGPTASGKTSTSINLAKHISGSVIVNFDSLLFYKEISIGTAKPTLEEQTGIPHYMIDIESIKSPMNAAQFIKVGEAVISDLFKAGKTVILVGGSAFYLRALLKGMYESQSTSAEIKTKLETWYKENGIAPFIDYLKIHDPESLVNLHQNDHYRLMRAVEHFEMNGTQFSAQKKQLDSLAPYDFTQVIHPWDILHIYLDLPKDQHFKIITERARKMFADGLLEEIAELKSAGFTMEEKPLASIGYKEAIDFTKGFYKSTEDCIERIAISTRQLAKSQRTFFNKIRPKESFNPLLDQAKILKRAMEFLS